MRKTVVVNEDLWYYIGQSMYPTLRSGDWIFQQPCSIDDLRCGDVIVFSPHWNTDRAVHRIVSLNINGIRTKGDNNREYDHWIVPPDAVVGRVSHVMRNGRKMKIIGGSGGRIYALVLTAEHNFLSLFKKIFHPCYNWLAREGVIRKIFSIDCRLKIIALSRESEKLYKLFWGSRDIGEFSFSERRWNIRSPFRLFIDEKRLPNYITHDMS